MMLEEDETQKKVLSLLHTDLTTVGKIAIPRKSSRLKIVKRLNLRESLESRLLSSGSRLQLGKRALTS